MTAPTRVLILAIVRKVQNKPYSFKGKISHEFLVIGAENED